MIGMPDRDSDSMTRRHALLPIFFGITLFLAALLSFLVQPMVAKTVLPYFGGSPAIWTVCMLFFQTMLLLGYAYADLLTRSFRVVNQVRMHLFCIVVVEAARPDVARIIAELDSSNVTVSPTLTLIACLIRAVGLPFLLLATTAPLLQHWYVSARGPSSRDPYFLYAASNFGSLVALAAYPLWFERHYRLIDQSRYWGRGLDLLLVLVILSGIWSVLRGRGRGGENEKPIVLPSNGFRISLLEWLSWVVLAFIPSSLLLGVTTYITTDLAAIPLLWAVPLGLYLVTFIVVFSRFSYQAEWLGRHALPLLVMVQAPVMAAGLVQPFWIPLHLLTFTAAALVCHGALADRRPGTERLTAFYLALAVGGALGGIFNAVLAPFMFNRLSEYPLAIVWACLALSVRFGSESDEELSWRTLIFPLSIGSIAVALFVNVRGINDSGLGILATMIVAGLSALVAWRHREFPVRFALTIAALLAASGFANGVNGVVIFRARSFFGVLTVTEIVIDGQPLHRLFHGSTLHGQQNFLPEKRSEPQTYFDRSGPIGQIFALFDSDHRDRESRIAVTGVGAGSLAAYARQGQRWTFYEIDPAVVRVARDPLLFTYFQDSFATSLETIIGDARLTMAKSADASFHLIILDAFSSDAIPAHLLTREALILYRRKLAPGGLIVVNITNRYLDLAPVVAALADDAGWSVRIRIDAGHSRADRERGNTGSIWAVLVENEAKFGGLANDSRWKVPEARPGASLWTDDFTSLVDHLRIRP